MMELEKGGYLYLMLVFMILIMRGEGQLRENFYAASCPNAETTVRQAVVEKMSLTATAPGTLRLFFHDCFVEGCDASIMIASPNNDAEKDASDNLSVAGDGFDTVAKAKQAVEAICPGVVSCADILAIAARDVVTLSGGPKFNVELGRRDGLVSTASRVKGNLPESNFNLDQLKSMFSKHNLSLVDLVALSGAHTIGFSHCEFFANRLYSFSPPSPIDPSLDPTYAQELIKLCPKNVDPTFVVGLDSQTSRTFDNLYYKGLVAGKGLLTSDAVLLKDPATNATVTDFANNPLNFNTAFATAMIKLGRVGVKTGNEGEIRSNCASFNT